MITSMNHTGLVVKDLEGALEFYRDALGLTVEARGEGQGSPTSEIVGYDGVHLRTAHLSAGEGHRLELIQYVHPPGIDRPSNERNTEGASHLGFNVDDIEQTLQRLVDRGARKLNPPAVGRAGGLVCYLQDPDGNWLELLEPAKR